MIRYKLTYLPTKEVYVSLDAERAETFAPIEFEGEDFPVSLVRRALLRCHGMDGHLIEEETTPIDLDAAMRSSGMQKFKPELESGGDILKITTRRGLP